MLNKEFTVGDELTRSVVKGLGKSSDLLLSVVKINRALVPFLIMLSYIIVES